MRFFKVNALAAAILSCLTTGCLQGVGPASTSPAASSTVSETPLPDDFAAKTTPVVAAEEGIRPKPDTSSLGNERNRIWRAYYGQEATLIEYSATLTIPLGGAPTSLDLRVQKSEGDTREWADAPVGQRLRLFLNIPSADPSSEPASDDQRPLLYCDETVTTLQGNPPENISANALSFSQQGTLLIYVSDATDDFFDCADGWAPADPVMADKFANMGSKFIANMTLRFPSLPQNNPIANAPASSGDQSVAVPFRPSSNKVLPLHLP